MFVGLLNGRTERKKKKKEKLERQKEKERERDKRGGRVKKQPSFTLPARGNPYRISNKYRSHIHYRPISGTWSAYQSWAQVAPSVGMEHNTRETPMVTPPGGFYQLNEKIRQNINAEEISYWLCEQRLRRVINIIRFQLMPSTLCTASFIYAIKLFSLNSERNCT